MYKYEVTFDFNYDYFMDDEDLTGEIEYIHTEELEKKFNSENTLKEFNEWIDDGEDNPINVTYMEFEADEETGYIHIETDNEIKDPADFAKEVVNFLFETDWPTVTINFSGYIWKDAWDYHAANHTETREYVDYNDHFNITYDNVTNIQIKQN